MRDGVPYYCASWPFSNSLGQSGAPDWLPREVFVSADILAKIREFEWIDDLTRDVFVASFIYFPNADAISLPHGFAVC